jgi:hypothetical protein
VLSSRTIDAVVGRMKSSRFTVKAVRVFGLAVSVIGIMGCGLGKNSDPSASTEASGATGIGSTTSVGSSATPAGVAPTVPITAAPPVPVTDEPGGLDTIEAANQNLWDAWRDDDRPRALAYATGAAVDSLFLSKWGPEVRNQGCGIAAGIPRCVYTLRGGARVVIMGQNPAGFFAQRVETIGALPSSNRLQSEIVDDTVVFDETGDANAIDPALSSDAAVSDGLSQDGLESPLTLAPGSDNAANAANAANSTNDATIGGGDGSNGSGVAVGSDATNTVKPKTKRTVRKTSKTPPKTTKAKTQPRRKTTAAVSSSEQSPEPAPAPSPEPAPGPVQAGRTVETVAP